MKKLWDWLFDFGNLYRFMHRERPNHRSESGGQLNNTCGVPIAFSEFFPAVGGRCWRLTADGGWAWSDLADVVPLPKVRG
jgi:hypothetical protein